MCLLLLFVWCCCVGGCVGWHETCGDCLWCYVVMCVVHMLDYSVGWMFVVFVICLKL